MDHEGWTRRTAEVFDSREVVADYAHRTALTPAEEVVLAPVLRPGLRILDLGVGTGRTTASLSRHADRYVGLDLSPGMIEVARQRHPTLELLEGDATDLRRFEDAAFDLVVFSYNGIDYLASADDRARCLDESRRVLEDGGHLVLSSHNARALLRPPARPLTVRNLAVAGRQSLARVADRRVRRAWRRGEGAVIDPARGGLPTWSSSPSRVRDLLAEHGFACRATVPGDLPRPARSATTPWWYYRGQAVGRLPT